MTFRLLRKLGPFLWRYRRKYAIGYAVLVVNVCVFASIPWILKLAIDALSAHAPARRIFEFAALLMGAVLVRAVLTYFQRLILITTSRDIEFDLRNEILRHIEKLSLPYFHRTRTGDLMARSTNDLNAVRNMLGPGIMYSANAIVLFVAVLAILLRIDVRLTLIAFLPAPFVSIAVQWFGKRIHERFERIQSMFSTLSTRVEENLAGLRIVRAYARERQEMDSFDSLNRDYIRRNLKLVKLSGAFDPLLQLLLGLAFVLVLWFGGRAVLEHRISLGSFVAFNAYMMQMAFPMIAMGWVINLVQRGAASLARIEEVLETAPEIADGPRTRPAPDRLRGDIEFRHLTFAYGSEPVLRDIDLEIPAGKTIAIVGHTGSGKSTLAALIPRFYEAPEGSLLVDGRPLPELPLATLRRNIGYVPQETFLFSDTLRANIAFGRDDATDEEVVAAADIANLSGDVAGFPDGFNTRVGERGLTLSGGQKQRAALARAILREPRILILDDALSSVDTLTEERILEGLDRVRQGRTTIIISHRISTIRNADLIVVLRDGAIVERGTHSTLIGLGGEYSELYERQLLEEELERV
jgi:ATP-binding cassette subfamily B multidrug efflux pump